MLAELKGDDDAARCDAIWLLDQIPYHDDAIIRALQKLNASVVQEHLV